MVSMKVHADSNAIPSDVAFGVFPVCELYTRIIIVRASYIMHGLCAFQDVYVPYVYVYLHSMRLVSYSSASMF